VNARRELTLLALGLAVFAGVYCLPVAAPRVVNAITEALLLLQWYAREHVMLCLVPAFFIAGAISVFVSQASVLRYFGPQAPKLLAYTVASVSGTILAVCSCTVLPLFAGIYKRGAGIGPATAFLYSGPAINVLAIILTARILGWQLGLARAVGAVLFSVIIGLAMQLIFRRAEQAQVNAMGSLPVEASRPLYQTALLFLTLMLVLIFATWGKPPAEAGFYHAIYSVKWLLASASASALAALLVFWVGVRWWQMLLAALPVLAAAVLAPAQPLLAFSLGVAGFAVLLGLTPGEGQDWLGQAWGLAKQIAPLLLGGVLVSGLLLGRPEGTGLIPPEWIASAVGGNSLWANLLASVVGALMYFATLTEVPILQGLLASGMGHGPALALLLAGPALSLPSMLVIASIMGWKKTGVYIGLVVGLSTIAGLIYGAFL
jgi:uncharacterized protein